MKACSGWTSSRRSAVLRAGGLTLLLLVTSNIILSSPLSPSLFSHIQPVVIDDKFKLSAHIKTGGFGAVYTGYNMLDNTPIAAKLETMETSSTLKNEYDMLMMMQGVEGVPHVYCRKEYPDIVNGRYQVVVMEKLWLSIKSITSSESKLPESSRIRNLLIFAGQAVQRLKDIHARGIIHKDMKPGNFLLGLGAKNNTVFVIDFGLASLYKRNDRHIVYSDGHDNLGTPGMQSFHNLLGEAPSRRDDMESLGYCLLSLYPSNRLPWAEHLVKKGNVEKSDHSEEILTSMMQNSIRDLCSGLPPEFTNYFRHVKSLGFYEEPNYDYLHKLFVSLYERLYGSYAAAQLVYPA